MNRARLVRYSLFAGAAAAVTALAVWLEWQALSNLWPSVVGFVEENWRPVFGGGRGRLLIFFAVFMLLEVCFLAWQNTTVFIVFVQRRLSAKTDLAWMVVGIFPVLKTAAEYTFTIGLAFVAVKLSDAAIDRLGWFRWELPSDGILAVTGAFAVFFLVSTFVQYWLHRLQHWRWFWQLHRLHHSGTEFNLFLNFRVSPAEGVTNVLLLLSPTIFLKVPNAGLFAVYMFVYQLVSTAQHSQLPWSYGWIGQWIMVSPQNHQIHHSIDEEHRDHNFSVCPLWDRLFGTWYAGTKRPSGYGIADPAPAERPLTQFFLDTWIFYRDIACWLANVVRSALAWIRGRRSPSQHAPDTAATIPAE